MKKTVLAILLLVLAAALSPALEKDMLSEQRRLVRVKSDLPGFTVKTVHAVTGKLPQIEVAVRPEKFERSWSVIGFWGEVAASGTIPADATGFTIPQQQRGYYTLVVKKEDKLYHHTVFAVVGEVPPMPRKESPFGVCTNFSHMTIHPEFASVIKAAGVYSLREGCPWSMVEAVKGKINQDHEVVQRVMQSTQGFNTMFFYAFGNRNYDGFSSPHTEEGLAAWKKYVEWLPNYFPQCREVEIWNEFNCAFLLRGVVAPTPENYLKLSKATYDAVKKAAPDKPVIGCSTSLLPWTWFEEYFKLGGLKYLDAVSCHPYRWGEWTTPPETLYADMIRLRELIRKYAGGRDIPIYADEFGWPCGDEWGVTPEMQAVYLPRAYANLLRAGVARGYWFKMILNPNEREQWQMMKQTDFNCYLPDPAYASLAALTRELHDAEFKREVPNLAPALGIELEQNREKVWQLWGTGKPVVLEVAAEGPVEVADLFGATRTLPPADGKVFLLLNTTTVYLRGPVKSIAVSREVTLEELAKPVFNNPMRVRFSASAGTTLKLRGQECRPGEITLPGSDRTGGSAVFGELLKDGKLCGLLFFEFDVAPQLQYQGMRLNKQGDLVVNFSNLLPDNPLRLTQITGTRGGKPINILSNSEKRDPLNMKLDLPVPADREAVLTIPGIASGLEPFELATLDLQFHFDNHAPLSAKASVTYAPCVYRRRFKSSFDLKDWEKQPAIDLAKFGTQIRDFFGRHVCDQYATTTGKMWLSWNENELLLTACFDDPVHYMKFPAWQTDCIQFAVGPLPASIETSLEYLACYRQEKNESLIFPSMIPAGFDGSAVTRLARCSFSRQGEKTIYMMAIPWEALPFIKPEAGKLFRFSLLVNGSDGGSRAGLCWGDGIWATKGSKFYPVCIFEK